MSNIEHLISELEAKTVTSSSFLTDLGDTLEDMFPKIFGELAPPATLVSSTEDVLNMINLAYPGWSIHISGRASRADGHWTATLRESDGRDNDLAIGIGKAPVLPRALLSALIKLRKLTPVKA